MPTAYKRKYIAKWKHQSVCGFLSLAVLFSLLRIGNLQAQVEQEFLSPLSDKDIQLVEYTIREIVKEYNQPQSIEDQIKFVFGEDGEDAIKVARCESSLNPFAQSKTGDSGLFQINYVHDIPRKYLTNPLINILVAKQLFDEQGWSPWYASYHCHKLK